MPIKLPKGFARRKSSGNILEEDASPRPQSSFHVYERPGPQRSMTDGAPLSKRMSEGHAVSSMLEDSDNIFAGTENPLAKHRYGHLGLMDSRRKRLTRRRRRHSAATYESSTSTRLSSSSTLPSSTEIPPADDASSPHSRIHDIPAPPPLAGALRAAGRTFSFGGRFGRSSLSTAPPRTATPDSTTKRRVMTSGSTDSTATPPRLPDAQFNLGTDFESGGDDFGKMFDHLGKRDSAVLRDISPRRLNQYSSSPSTQNLAEFQSENRAPRPAPIHINHSATVEPSPYSWGKESRNSEENLLNDPSLARMGDLVIDANSPAQSPAESEIGLRRSSPSSGQMLGATTSHRALERPRRQSDFGLRRSVVYSGTQAALPIEDEDAKLVRQSVLWTKENSPPSNETPLLGKGKATSSPKNENLSTGQDSMFSDRHSPAPVDAVDPSIADQARLVVQFAESLPKSPSPGNKVMTPSQFEHYRQQQELRRSNSSSSRSDDESVNDNYDEEDEAEKQREAEQQRRKQEAHLSVYRQQMKKVTGQQTPSPLLRPVTTGPSSSTPNLSRLSHLGDKSSSGKSSEEDDEEVPLGILAAHGFPNRNRPPTRLTNVGSNPNLRASMHPHVYVSSARSVAGGEQSNRDSLPVFARNLPRDPYFGAGLVHPPNRESLAMGGGSGSVYGGPSSPGPPGGLIGVIANEERARAMRRGSPNHQALYENMAHVPRPFSMMAPQPQQVTASEQAQVQLSQQMANMMQMQMRWMQQMMEMQGLQGGAPTLPMMGAPPMPGTPMGPPSMGGPPPSVMGGMPGMRPNSMFGQPGVLPNFDQRTLSMLDPNIPVRRTASPMLNLPGQPFRPSTAGYAPSIAPSERSNAGLAPRYRPVSTMQDAAHHSTSPLNKGWNDENQSPTVSVPRSQAHLPKSTSLAAVTVRPFSRTGQSPAGHKPQNGEDDDNDDEGWAEMMKKRDKKKSSWKLKRATSSFGDLLNAVH